MNLCKRPLSRLWYLHLRRRDLPSRIVVEVAGGLGNQIWHWAFGQAVAARSSIPVSYDLTWYNGEPRDVNGRERRNFGLLDAFPGAGVPACPPEDALILRRCTFVRPADRYAFYESELSNAAPRWLGGYYWHLGYLRAVPNSAWASLAFAQSVLARGGELAGRIDSEPAAVAVHVRRGDYVGMFMDAVKPAYYYRAIEELKARLAPLTPVFFVFSDDSEWARGMFASRSERFVYAGNANDDAVLDMALMARCQHFIIANSTFSFFAAFLSRRAPDRRVVAAPLCPLPAGGLTNGLSETEFPGLIKIPAAG